MHEANAMTNTPLPIWRQLCFSAGLGLVGIGIFTKCLLDVHVINAQQSSEFRVVVGLALLCASVLCLFGKGWPKIALSLVGVFFAAATLLNI